MFAEIKEQFTYNQIREHLFGQLLVVVDILKQARCPEIYLDGSFITKKQFPNDFDLCWVRIWQSDKDGDAKGIIRILLEN